MELRHLEQILAVCREGGFSGAARRLHLTQPTLSKSIARLEDSLSIKLFEREGGAARPTSYGAFVAARAEALLQRVASLSYDLEQLARGEEGRVRIAVGPATRLRPLPQFLSLVAKRLPQLSIETFQATGPQVVEAVHDDRADLAFAYAEHGARYGDLIRKRLFEDRIILVARRGHPATAFTAAHPAHLLKYPFALTSVVPGFRRWLGELDARQAAHATAFVSDDYLLVTRRALETDAIAAGPAFIFERELREGTLCTVPSTLDLVYTCWILTTAERWRAPLVKELAKIAAAAADCGLEG